MTAGSSPDLQDRPCKETQRGFWGPIRRGGPGERRGRTWSRWIPHRLVSLSRTGGSAAAVWGIREREMMIMEMSKLSLWKIKQATDCFYITFTHWHAGLLRPPLPYFQSHAHTHTHVMSLFSLLSPSVLSLVYVICYVRLQRHTHTTRLMQLQGCSWIHQTSGVSSSP